MALQYTKLIHEKLSTVLTFAYSLAPVEKLLESRFKGEWKYLRKTIYDVGSENAVRSCIELATFLRLLDDEQNLSRYLQQNPGDRGLPNLGRVTKQDGTIEPLYLRDMTNKIIHAKDWRWDVSIPDQPRLICISDDPERWFTAEIDIEALAALCGSLIH
jgi:hypothetical protein